MTDLSQASDEDLLTELAWRGYKVELYGKRQIRRMPAHEFKRELELAHGVKFQFGYRRELLWQVLLNAFPEVATHERIRGYCFQSNPSACDEASTVAALVCIENKALRKTPWRIANVWGVGYRLEKRD